jgi:hypothetical protein
MTGGACFGINMDHLLEGKGKGNRRTSSPETTNASRLGGTLARLSGIVDLFADDTPDCVGVFVTAARLLRLDGLGLRLGLDVRLAHDWR